jgi:hypothetical protein
MVLHGIYFVSMPTNAPVNNLHLMLYGYGSNQGNGQSGNPLGKFNNIKSNAPFI